MVYRDYLILFRIESSTVLVLRVLHGRRDWQETLQASIPAAVIPLG